MKMAFGRHDNFMVFFSEKEIFLKIYIYICVSPWIVLCIIVQTISIKIEITSLLSITSNITNAGPVKIYSLIKSTHASYLSRKPVNCQY